MVHFVLAFFFAAFYNSAWVASPASLKNRLEFFSEGKKNFHKHEYADAIENLRRFLREQPYAYEVRDALFYLGESYIKTGNYLEAVSHFNTLSGKFPKSKYRTVVLFKKGYCYYQLKITTKSERNLKSYLKFVKENNLKKGYRSRSHFYLGLLYKSRKEYKEAIRHLKLSLDLSQKRSRKYGSDQKIKQRQDEIYYELGVIYAKHFREKKIAFYYLKKYMKSKKDIPSSLKFTMRGLSLFHLDTAEGLPDRSISDIKVDGDDIWVSTWGGGLVRFSRSSEKFERVPLPSSQIRNLYIDFDRVYICTYDGIFIYDKRSGKTKPMTAQKQVFTLAQKVIKDDRYLYFSTLSRGVVRYDSVNGQIATLGKNSFLGSNRIYSITADHRYIVFGTIDSGLVIYNKKERKATYLNEEHIDGDNVKSILLDGRFLWIGVHKHGIYKYDLERRKLRKMNWHMSYPSVIAKREHEIWVGSSGDGIRVYNQKTEQLEKIRAIEGLASNEVHLIEIETDYIWIGYLDSGIDLLYRPLE